MSLYAAYGSAGGTVANQAPYAQLWNPSATRRIKLVQWSFFSKDSGGGINRPVLVRSTARGATPNATVTPDADNSERADSVPPSGAVLELGPFGTSPTLASPYLYCPVAYLALGGDGFVLPLPRAIVVPPGTGVVLTWFDTTVGDTIVGVEAGVAFED
jgi:hypothetical protein